MSTFAYRALGLDAGSASSALYWLDVRLDASIFSLDVVTRRLDATEHHHRLDAHRSLDVKPRRHGSTQARLLDARLDSSTPGLSLSSACAQTQNSSPHLLRHQNEGAGRLSQCLRPQ